METKFFIPFSLDVDLKQLCREYWEENKDELKKMYQLPDTYDPGSCKYVAKRLDRLLKAADYHMDESFMQIAWITSLDYLDYGLVRLIRGLWDPDGFDKRQLIDLCMTKHGLPLDLDLYEDAALDILKRAKAILDTQGESAPPILAVHHATFDWFDEHAKDYK